MTRSVATEPLDALGVMDLVLHGIDASGDRVILAWSEVTGEVFTLSRREPHTLTEVYGRVLDLPTARTLQDACARDAQGNTLVETAKLRLRP